MTGPVDEVAALLVEAADVVPVGGADVVVGADCGWGG